jgi:hypothetical protein
LWILGREEDEHPKQRKILPPKFIKRKSCPTDEGLSGSMRKKYPQVLPLLLSIQIPPSPR